MTYAEKLQDPRWQKKRLEMYSRDNFTCRCCGDTKDTLNLHHKEYIYGKEPCEYEDDNFITVCFVCHEVLGVLKNLNLFPDFVYKRNFVKYPNEYKIYSVCKYPTGQHVLMFHTYNSITKVMDSQFLFDAEIDLMTELLTKARNK